MDKSAINFNQQAPRGVSGNSGSPRIRARVVVVALVLAAGVLSGGCVTGAVHYPSEWAAVSATPSGACPILEGRYVDTGTVADGCTRVFGNPAARRTRSRGAWDCQTSLASNIADSQPRAWFELRQPDADTLVMTSSDSAIGTKVLHRSHGDYSCGAEGLTRKQHFNVASFGDDSAHTSVGGAVLSTIGTAALLAEGGMVGVRTLTRSFSPAEDGSLVMSVSRADAETLFLIPAYFKDATFVRWQRVPNDTATAPAAPAAPATPAAPLPAVAAVTSPSAQPLR